MTLYKLTEYSIPLPFEYLKSVSIIFTIKRKSILDKFPTLAR